MFKVSFFAPDDSFLFSEHLEEIPRVGELISYSFEPTHRESWSPEDAASKDQASQLVNRCVVTEVCHLIRRISVNSAASHAVAVTIKSHK
jgi:hypothetical protein